VSDVLRSALLDGLGVRHAFGPLRARPDAEPAADPADDRRRFVASAGIADRVVYEVSQVHGAGVRRVSPGDDAALVRAVEADALVASSGGHAVAVRVADCVAVLVCDPERGGVAAVHAGWRGAVRGVLGAALGELARDGTAPERFAAAHFPHIRPCCFEVGEDVATEIARAAGTDDVVIRGRAKPHVDLARVVRAQLEAAGLRPERVDDVAGCTRCEPERFYSYRRDGANAGRHFAAIVSR
jgi:YfiH family protein